MNIAKRVPVIVRFTKEYLLLLHSKNYIRFIYSSSIRELPQIPKNENPETQTSVHMKNNWISPPHPVSNLRKTFFPPSTGHTKEEKLFWKVQTEVHHWNNEFWEKHNAEFQKQKASFTEQWKKHRKLKDDKNEPHPTAEDMSVFYKEFLDKNHMKHVNYNWEWYGKNFYLLWLALKAQISRFYSEVLNGKPVR